MNSAEKLHAPVCGDTESSDFSVQLAEACILHRRILFVFLFLTFLQECDSQKEMVSYGLNRLKFIRHHRSYDS